MPTVPDMGVVPGHRPAGNGHHEPATRPHEPPGIDEEPPRLVDVLEHLRAHCVCRPPVVFGGRRCVDKKVSLDEDGIRDLGTGELDSGLAQLDPDKLGVGERLSEVERQVSRARPDIKDARRGRPRREKPQDEAPTELLGGIRAPTTARTPASAGPSRLCPPPRGSRCSALSGTRATRRR